MNATDPTLGASLDRGYTLPARWYTDPAILAREKERIFRNTWQFVGLAAQASRPGDFFTSRLGDVPIVVVCDESHQRRAFVNVCRHRGSELVLEKRGNKKTLQCHYHAWTWGLDGHLRAAPCSAEQASFDKDDFPLKRVSIDAWGPFLFVHLDPNAPPLADTLRELPGLVSASGANLGVLSHRERRTYTMACNWKVVVENFLECYHCAIAHPQFTGLIDLNAYEVRPYGLFSVQRGPLKASAQEKGYYDTSGGAKEGIYAFLWPNFMVNAYPGAGNASANLIVPIDEHTTLAIFDFFFADSLPDDEAKKLIELIDRVQMEDQVLCESVQRGLRSGFYDQGKLMLTRENGIQHFQKLVYGALGGGP